MDPIADIPALLPLWQRVSGGDPSVRIAVIDGPVDVAHPALRGARLSSDRTTDGALPVRSEHGTHVTSVIVGQPGSGVLGIAPNCTVEVYSIYREGAHGELEPASQSMLALAINRALADGADIINISSGQQVATGQPQRLLADAVRSCVRAGTLIVAAAGNDGCRCLQGQRQGRHQGRSAAARTARDARVVRGLARRFDHETPERNRAAHA